MLVFQIPPIRNQYWDICNSVTCRDFSRLFQKSLNKRNRWALAICVGKKGIEPHFFQTYFVQSEYPTIRVAQIKKAVYDYGCQTVPTYPHRKVGGKFGKDLQV